MKIFSNKPAPEDWAGIEEIVRSIRNDPEKIPFSFNLGTDAFRGIPRSFRPKADHEGKRFIWEGEGPGKLRIIVDAVLYEDFPVADWTVRIKNEGTENSLLITDFTGFDGYLKGSVPKIITSNGDTTDADLYTETTVDLSDTWHFCQKPDGGRSCDSALPYYRVLCEEQGYIISIGWPGQWLADFRKTADGFHLSAKQEYTRFYLKPGECVRSPRMTILSFTGTEERGINLWRRFLFAHIIPKNAVAPSFALGDEPDSIVFFAQTTEKREIASLDHLRANGMIPDVWWIDAGWYPCKNPEGVNEWFYTGALHADKERFPNSLRPVSDACHKQGTKLLLWFEPERVKMSARTDEYGDGDILTLKDTDVLDSIRMTGIDRSLVDDTGLKNLGDKECCDRLIETVDAFIRENGIDIYRQDFNFPPLNWWLQNDEDPLRQGMTENLYNQGYLRFFDEIIKRNPNVWINSVSSGGRRSDLETMARSVSLHQSDYGYGQHPLLQEVMIFGYTWMAYFGTFVQNHDDLEGNYNYVRAYERPYEKDGTDNFAAHNAFCPFMHFNRMGRRSLSVPGGGFAETEEGVYYRKFRDLWKRAVPYLLEGDFYLLRRTDRTNKGVQALQFHNENTGEGILQIISNTKTPEQKITVYPFQFDPESEYILESPEFERKFSVTGREANESGITVEIPPRTGEIFFYKKAKC